MATLEERIKTLTPGAQEKVARFLDDLEREQSPERNLPVRQSWAGALSDLKDQYTSLELQKEAVDLWAECD